jgi:tetratricopeptide (TPR) repeat protein
MRRDPRPKPPRLLDQDQCQGLPGAPSVSAMTATQLVRALNITAILLAGFLLSYRPSLAQSLDAATALAQQVIALTKRGHYSQAVPFAQRALAIREEVLGPDHPDVARALNSLAVLYKNQGRYADADHCTSDHWRSGKRSSAPIISKLRTR